jgi:hypothetical protein
MTSIMIRSFKSSDSHSHSLDHGNLIHTTVIQVEGTLPHCTRPSTAKHPNNKEAVTAVMTLITAMFNLFLIVFQVYSRE